ncbi:LacI family DNA-binding transcriptional regulator [Actinomycetaceae bacterium L2_0104]
MAVTIKDVARSVGVSPSTVSRAFSRPEKVDPGTRGLILATAGELGYHPNRAAQSLSAGKTGYVAAFIPDLTNPFFAATLKGIYTASAESDLRVTLTDFGDSAAVERTAIADLTPQVDGFVLCSSRLDDDEIRLLADRRPVLLVNRQLDGIPYVHIDNAQGVRQAFRHLQALGHTKIGYAGGPALSRSQRERREAFAAMAAESAASSQGGTGTQGVVLGEFASTFDGGSEAADEALHSEVTAVIAYNDVMAIGMIHRLLGYGVRVPDRLSVVGCDDIPISGMVTPSLTTVRLPQGEMGALAAQLLGDIISGKPIEPVEMHTSLVVRASTGPKRVHS